MIESLIQDRGLKAVKVAGTHGGEWACPCPACGGKDRFRFWPAQGEGGTWYCRQCDKGGDSIQFLREFEGLSYTEACRRLGVERTAAPTSIMPRADKAERPWEPSPTPADPGPVWQEHAAKLLDYAHARLLADEDRMKWLAMRGIFPDVVERFRLGWLPGENGKDCYHRDRGAWGLPPETNARGRKKSLWIPAGLVVPALTEDGTVRRLRIRRTDEARVRFGAEMKSVVVPGSSMRPLLLRPEARAFVVVEAELDAMACVAAAMDAGLDVGPSLPGPTWGVRMRQPMPCCAVPSASSWRWTSTSRTRRDSGPGPRACPSGQKPTARPAAGRSPRAKTPGTPSGKAGIWRTGYASGCLLFSRLRLCRRHQPPSLWPLPRKKSRPMRPWALDGWTTRGAGRKKRRLPGHGAVWSG